MRVGAAYAGEQLAFRPSTGGTNQENWLGKGSKKLTLAPGQTVDFDVAPGSYAGAALGCEFPKSFGVIEGLTIQQPTFLAIGDGATTPSSPGEAHATMKVALARSPDELNAAIARLAATHQRETGGGGGACVSGACDPNGDPCCGGIACVPDATMSAGHFYCGTHP